MNILICLSAARHPVSDRPALSRLEAQAIGLATRLDGRVTGLHAGPDGEAVREALGVGLSLVDHLAIGGGVDPLEALSARLRAEAPDLILAGRRGQGGEDSGLVPYCLAEALDLPLIADAVAIETGPRPGTIRVDQALKKGDRRRITVKLPAIVTVHPLAPAPAPFVFAAARRGTIRTLPVLERHDRQDAHPGWNERPYRARPKLMRTAATPAGDPAGKLHVDPAPEEAARLILDYLEKNGIRTF
ncbi:electron transfer flavoprotein subunit beta [Fulvimarina sp. 2208YS6-2-32]|uniref:Electron transfer flavoprotein subunit beta n=1 Tax=Fulvimarina uroteuthidis TaxID=3098149 RepID=A0ABU5I486_9HYPH|nr:electron transfer flavoprotein subunit beta [Fulvimarina sp. 2208YS6-2-32]MDY8110021.1 electron transfer flavoprotein subunit beta [Fulvimarina sp. 2208YS6-2-32]